MRHLTMSDLCELTGYSRDQMRGLLAELSRFAQRRSAARVARVYSSQDLVLVVLLCRLETHYGLKRSVVSSLCEPIAATLEGMREVSKGTCLVIQTHEATCECVDTAPLLDDGLVVSLGPIFLSVDRYLLPTPLMMSEAGKSAASGRFRPTVSASQVARTTRPARSGKHQQGPRHG
jgi:hypothetical protein